MRYFNSYMHKRSVSCVCNSRHVDIHCPVVDPLDWPRVLAAATPRVQGELLRLRAYLMASGNSSFPRSHLSVADADELIASKHVELVDDNEAYSTTGTCTPFFVLEERESGPRRRFILWPKAQNVAAYTDGFRPDVPLEHVSRYLAAVDQACAGLRDLKVAFWQVELSPQERANFRFLDVSGRIFQPTRLPMGFCASVDIMHRITEIIAGSTGFAKEVTPRVAISCWVDGIRVAGQVKDVSAALRTIDVRAEQMAVTFKEFPPPQQVYDFVGVTFDHNAHRTRCKDTTLAKLDVEVVTARDFLALFGRLMFAAGANRTPLAEFYFAIKKIRRLANRLQRHPEEMDLPLASPPTPIFLALLNRLTALVREWSPSVEKVRPISATLFSDASLDGWGAVLCLPSGEVHSTGERWSEKERVRDISVLECDAVKRALADFYHHLPAVGALELRVDNSSLQAGLRRGGARSEDLNAALLPVLRTLLTDFPSCRVVVGYVPTKENPADGPSRGRAPGPVPRSCSLPAVRPLRISA